MSRRHHSNRSYLLNFLLLWVFRQNDNEGNCARHGIKKEKISFLQTLRLCGTIATAIALPILPLVAESHAFDCRCHGFNVHINWRKTVDKSSRWKTRKRNRKIYFRHTFIPRLNVILYELNQIKKAQDKSSPPASCFLFGGEGEIWTLAPLTRPTPLAGAPLHHLSTSPR